MNARTSPSLLKAGASTPVKATASLLMWSVISSELALLQHGGSRSVGKTSVKGKRGSVYLSLLVGHDSHFDLSADQLLDRLAGSRSHKFTVSATKGLTWVLDSTCRDKRQKHSCIQGNMSRCSQNHEDLLTFITLQMIDRLSETHTWYYVVQCHDNFIQMKCYLLLITQQQSKDLNSLNDKTDSVQH